MLRQEFEQRTGFYPTSALYREIEKRYNADESIDKDEFCKRYKENADGLAESIQIAAERDAWNKEKKHREAVAEKEVEIINLKKQIEKMEERIEELEGWKPYEVSKIRQDEYEQLRGDKATKEFSEETAREWLAEEFGFSKERIKVFQRIPLYQIEKRGIIRNNGSVERPPVYNATDWNYIRFDVAGWQYEVVNGQIYHYED